MADKLDIKLIALDVDGVLSDGRILYTSTGEEIKDFHTQDGMGLAIARAAGIKTAIITGRKSAMVQRRGEELKFSHIIMNCRNKSGMIMKLAKEEGIELENIAFMGDDLNDLGALNLVGLPMAPANAREENKARAKFVTKASGGHGAVREAVEYILKEMNIWPEVIKRFENETYDEGQ